MKTLILSVLIFLGSIGIIIAQNSELAAANLDQVNLPDSVFKAIDSVFVEFSNMRSPGCSVGVLKDGKLVFARGYGMASLEHDIEITPQTSFYAGSVSKQFVAFAVALLADRGKLSLDDNIRTWIPEVPDFGSQITVRHLLHHTSGLRDYYSLLALTGWTQDGRLTMEEVLGLVNQQKALNFPPGTRYLYSNTGYVLLATLVERASGQSLREFAEAEIFQPLGMNNTTFRDDHTMLIKNRALAYTPDSEAESGFRLSMPGFDVVGAGGLYTTVQDLARWAENFESQKLGGIRVANMMLTPGVLTSGDTLDYALGLAHGSHRGLITVGHGGSYAGYRANFVRFPGQDMSVFMLCNREDANPGSRSIQVADVFLGEHMKPIEARSSAIVKIEKEAGIKLDPKLLDRYTGMYRMEAAEALLQLSRKKDHLILTDVGNVGPSETTPLIALSDTLFQLKDRNIRIRFQSSAGQMAPQAAFELANGHIIPWRRIEPWDPTLQELREFEGRYYSPEVDAFYTIVLEDDRLVARHRRQADLPFTPSERDTFASGDPFRFVFFDRSKDGQIISFLVSAGRVKNIRFEKQE